MLGRIRRRRLRGVIVTAKQTDNVIFCSLVQCTYMSSTIWDEALNARVQCDLKTNAISGQEEKVKVSHQFTYNTYTLSEFIAFIIIKRVSAKANWQPPRVWLGRQI